MKNLKYIFVVGGVMSGVGKGVAAASIGRIIQSRGFSVTAIKIDPYVNVDAGTMNPTEHGEIFVLKDGTECDQDLGNYERFLDKNLSRDNYMTTGSIYLSVINRERSLGYSGKCVEVVPHIPIEVIERINKAAKKDKAEVVIVEVGGTVGEYQNILFLEAIRMMKLRYPGSVLLALVSYLPEQSGGGELKTKPTQYAVRTLNSVGLQPDIIIARARVSLDKKRKSKIAFNCSMTEESIISAPDVSSIYEIPSNFEKDNLGLLILKKLSLKPKGYNFKLWQKLVKTIRSVKKPVRIGIVGKYFETGDFVLADSYISVIEAIKHAAYFLKRKPEIFWLDACEFEMKGRKKIEKLKKCNGVIVPGGFGERGVEGKIEVIKYLRKNKIPFLGLCYGMQLAVVEYARSVLGLKKAHTTEIAPSTSAPVVDVLPEQQKNIIQKKYGGTMRLGSYLTKLKPATIAYRAYRKLGWPMTGFYIEERHRHRYEINPSYVSQLEGAGLVFSGVSVSRENLMEIMELPKRIHPFFVATQFHPEFNSRPLRPHPLFVEFVKMSIKNNKIN